MKKLSSIILGIFLTFSLFAEARNALLIANGDYAKFGKLAAPVKEARDLKKTLEKLGFSVMLVENGSREKMLDSLYDFEEILEKNGGIAFFLYSGHGVQVNGKNYLIPVDADIPDERRVSTRAVDVDEVMESMQGDTNIVILDACRDNPLPKSSTKGATKGLALTDTKPKNSIIIYSAQPNKTAWDGVFTPILTKKIVEQKEFGSILKEVRKEVLAKTNGEQSPGEYNELITDVYLAGYSTASSNTQSNNNVSAKNSNTNVTVGYYTFESMSEANETITAADLRNLLGDDSDIDIGSLILKKDGTGRMTLMDDQTVLSWDNKKITIDGTSASYSLNNNKLTISEDGSTIVFVKKQNIMDYAKLLSDTETSVLSYNMAIIESQYGIGMYVVNLVIDDDDINNIDMNDFAEFIYDEEDLGLGNSKDGVMLFLEGNSGTLIVYTHGSTTKRIFSDDIIYKMKYAFIDGLDVDEASWYYAYDYYIREIESAFVFAEKSGIVTSNSINIQDGFVFVEGGTFIMGNNAGSSDEKPEHKVTVSSFYICDHEVTQSEYLAVMFPDSPSNDQTARLMPTWYNAIEYCNKLSERKGLTPCYEIKNIYSDIEEIKQVTCNFSANGYRLPTEAEWEYAARGGKKSKDYTYSGSNNIKNVAWYSKNQNDSLPPNSYLPVHEIKKKSPNELGLYDMSGNLYEWCWDLYGSYNNESVINPTGASWGNKRVVRGGYYGSSADNCSVTKRNRAEENIPIAEFYGFRLVRTAQ